MIGEIGRQSKNHDVFQRHSKTTNTRAFFFQFLTKPISKAKTLRKQRNYYLSVTRSGVVGGYAKLINGSKIWQLEYYRVISCCGRYSWVWDRNFRCSTRSIQSFEKVQFSVECQVDIHLFYFTTILFKINLAQHILRWISHVVFYARWNLCMHNFCTTRVFHVFLCISLFFFVKNHVDPV